MANYDQFVVDDFYKMSFQNVFHYKKMNISNLLQLEKQNFKLEIN